MKTKQEKIKEWAFGFEHGIGLYNRDGELLGVYDEDVKHWYYTPTFQDDQPEPKDKALQEYAVWLFPNSGNDKWIAALQETNTRIKDLEAAVARLEAANEKQ